MILSAVIETIDYNNYTCEVQLPDLQSAADDLPVIKTAAIAEVPGLQHSYKKGDLVWVAFVRDEKKFPVVIGKLVNNTNISEPGGALQLETLEISGKATLPGSINFKNNEPGYDNLTGIINKLKAATNFIETYKDLDYKLKETLTALETFQKTIIDIDSRLKAIEQSIKPDTPTPEPESETN